ncbi:MAG: TetR/AcrR family transcriptional regulator [Methylobacterium mesophilicum]|nr:TetR/AcrR family transcriptional regulator [Methylobacterium mesophilicum]
MEGNGIPHDGLGHETGTPSQNTPAPPPPSSRDKIIEALMQLAAERDWEDFSVSDVAERAGVTLADFRDAFPSKGAVLAGLSKKIDRTVLEGTTDDLRDETPKERLFDVLMRRLDAMQPYKLGLEGVAAWVKRDPLAASALNGVALNSMRFMLEAAGIDSEKRAGALKLQGLVLAWTRVLHVWFKDDEPGQARTMAALDRELTRGETWAARVDDLDRLIRPVGLLARSIMNAGGRLHERRRDGAREASRNDPDTGSAR